MANKHQVLIKATCSKCGSGVRLLTAGPRDTLAEADSETKKIKNCILHPDTKYKYFKRIKRQLDKDLTRIIPDDVEEDIE